jgi:hypothetical protein
MEITSISRIRPKPTTSQVKEVALITASTDSDNEKHAADKVNAGKVKWVKNITLPVLVNEIFSKPPEGVVEQPMPATAMLNFIFAVVGIFVAGIPLGLLAILLGGFAIGKINRNPGMQGKGLAIAGIAIGVVAIIGALYVISTM